VSLEHSPARNRKAANIAVNDPSYTVDEFCAAERMSLRCSTKPGQKAGVPSSTGWALRAALLTARALSGSASAKRRPQRGRRKNDLANSAAHQPR
jgi:hypothetical protein